MIKTLKKPLFLAVMLPIAFAGITACATSKMLEPTEADAERARASNPEITLTDLQSGKKLFEEKCVLCHELKKPASQTAEKWKEIVPGMARRANKKEVRIDPKQEELIRNYLVVMSEAKGKKG